MKRGKQFLTTTNIDNGLSLASVHYVNSNAEYLILNYERKGGLLMLENYDLKLWDDIHTLENNFHPFPLFINSNHYDIDIAVSNDQQFVSITNLVSQTS